MDRKTIITKMAEVKEEDILEIEVPDNLLDLPVAAFPPFKLRSSMVDTDPVIWVHLIEVYIQYVQTVTHTSAELTERSEQQLCLFVKSYLHEIAQEQGQLLSLGLINVQITENLATLRAWMFELVKHVGTLRLKLNGEALWDLAKIYALNNASQTRGIIDGTLKPPGMRALSGISHMQRQIESLVSNGKFSKVDLETLASLLTEKKGVDKPKKAVRNNQKQSFGDKFVTTSWWGILEKLYANGQGRFADQCKDLAILSLISISIARVASLATELGLVTIHSLGLSPLFAGIVSTKEFEAINPGLAKKLPFLIVREKAPVNQDNVQSLIDMFPDLTVSQTQKLLRKHNHDVGSVTHLLLEDPEAATKPVVVEPKVPTASSIIKKKVISKQNKHTQHVPDELTNRTLTAALKLMYEADDDEHDDTYDDAEPTSGVDDSKYDNIERYLWEIFKKDQGAFDQSARKSRKRKEIKDETKWADEQIEGWARMIQKSPKRAKILEEKYMFRGNKPQKPRTDETAQDTGTSEARAREPRNGRPQTAQQEKIQNVRNERNKASKANHNRKAGHDKKLARA